MRVGSLKDTGARFRIPNIKNLKIQAWGENNLYPQDAYRILSSSDSGVVCHDRYAKFIAGNGFENEIFAAMQANPFGDTTDDILQLLASDLASYNGFAIHINYDVMGQIISIQHIPFEHCRLGEMDELGGVSKIAVFPDWEGNRTFGGKKLRPALETVDYIDLFNPQPEVVIAQIEYAGGIENYKGQILWVSNAGRNVYPLAKYDAVIGYLSAEDSLSTITNRNIRNGMFSAGLLMVREGLESNRFEEMQQVLSELQGDHNTNNIALLRYEQEMDKPEFIPFRSTNYDKEFTVTSENASERIYAAFGQEMFYRLRLGAVGFSSDIVADAFKMYNSVTSTQRRMLERAFDAVVTNWHEPISENSTAIAPLEYEVTEDVVSEAMLTTMYEKDIITKNDILAKIGMDQVPDGGKYLSDSISTPLAVRLGVGGTQALQAVITDITLTEESKIGTLEVLFSLSRADAEKLVKG